MLHNYPMNSKTWFTWDAAFHWYPSIQSYRCITYDQRSSVPLQCFWKQLLLNGINQFWSPALDEWPCRKFEPKNLVKISNTLNPLAFPPRLSWQNLQKKSNKCLLIITKLSVLDSANSHKCSFLKLQRIHIMQNGRGSLSVTSRTQKKQLCSQWTGENVIRKRANKQKKG